MNVFAAMVDEKLVSPGLLGFVVVAVIGVALYFLIKSMNRQIAKIDFDEGAEQPRAESSVRAKDSAEPTREETTGKE